MATWGRGMLPGQIEKTENGLVFRRHLSLYGCQSRVLGLPKLLAATADLGPVTIAQLDMKDRGRAVAQC